VGRIERATATRISSRIFGISHTFSEVLWCQLTHKGPFHPYTTLVVRRALSIWPTWCPELFLHMFSLFSSMMSQRNLLSFHQFLQIFEIASHLHIMAWIFLGFYSKIWQDSAKSEERIVKPKDSQVGTLGDD
jgi:hypothetical protein